MSTHHAVTRYKYYRVRNHLTPANTLSTTRMPHPPPPSASDIRPDLRPLFFTVPMHRPLHIVPSKKLHELEPNFQRPFRYLISGKILQLHIPEASTEVLDTIGLLLRRLLDSPVAAVLSATTVGVLCHLTESLPPATPAVTFAVTGSIVTVFQS